MPICVVGLGLDINDLPPKVAERIAKAQVLVGGKRHLQHYADHPGEKLAVTAPLSKVIEAVDGYDKDDKDVVVLATGDPLFFGIGTTLLEAFGPGRVELMPNVSTLQVAAARTKIPWSDVATISLHGREDMRMLYEALTRNTRVAVLTDARSIPAAIAQALLDKGSENYRMWVFEDLESERERVDLYDLATASQKTFSRLNLVLLERLGPPANPLCLGIPDERFAVQDRLLTKWPVRAAGIAALQLVSGNVLWDLGSGCGALAIEAAAVMGSGTVWAVEKRSDRVQLIRENIRRCQALQVEAVHGTMPRCLDELPDPDRIFIGGGLSRDPEILDVVCDRLAPGGRLVVHCILLDTIALVRNYLQEAGWRCEITMLQASHSAPLGKDVYLKAENAVSIISASKHEG